MDTVRQWLSPHESNESARWLSRVLSRSGWAEMRNETRGLILSTAATLAEDVVMPWGDPEHVCPCPRCKAS